MTLCQDLAVIIDRLNNVGDSKPFVFHEVIDRNDGAVTVQQYYDIGKYSSQEVNGINYEIQYDSETYSRW